MERPLSPHLREVLFIEAYHGGSHKSFAEGFAERLPFETTLWTMPPRKWKWRMRGAAVTMAEKARAEIQTGGLGNLRGFPGLIVTSSMLNVAEFKGLLSTHIPFGRSLPPVLLMMHENQFEYPVTQDDERDMHFALTNLTSCMAAERIAWNSSFNQKSFFEGVRALVKRMPDERFDAAGIEERIGEKSRILPPPIDPPDDLFSRPGRLQTRSGPLRILWNHRWEHDKAPEVFFEALYRLSEDGVAFELAVLGESFARGAPGCFTEAETRLSGHIVSWGYTASRRRYWEEVAACDVVVSTAEHEFFGMSVMEAAAAGCRPLLPRRLSYPELFPDEALYKSPTDMVAALKALAAEDELRRLRQSAERARWSAIARGHTWDALTPEWTALAEETAALR